MQKILFVLLLILHISPMINGLEIAGSSTIQPIVTKAGILFSKKTGIMVNVRGGGSGFGAKSTINGLIDIGTCSRDLKSII